MKGNVKEMSHQGAWPKGELLLVCLKTQEEVRDEIGKCQKAKHIQQVAYSTYHDALTQVCFACKRVRTSMEVSP